MQTARLLDVESTARQRILQVHLPRPVRLPEQLGAGAAAVGLVFVVCSATRRMHLVCDTGPREHTNIERAIEIAGVTPKLKFVAGGRLLSRGIRFCSRWPAFPLAGGRLVSRGIRFGSWWPGGR